MAIVKALDVALVDSKDVNGILERFTDADKITEGLQVYVATAVQNELMKGYENGTFRPQGKLTRAEAAVLIYRMMLKFKIVVGE